MKILIIGGTGLISTPLVAQLLAGGDDITIFNRGHNAAPVGVRQMIGDRTHYAAFENQMHEANNFDCVIDMVGYYPEDAHSLVRAFGGQIGHLVFCSTVDVYAKPASHYPVREDEAYGGLNDYACRKISIEKTLWAAHERGDFPVTILRPAHTYNDNGAIIHGFGPWLSRLRAGQPIIVHGDGTSLWSQAHAEDVAWAFVNAVGNAQAFGKGYTVTNEETHPWTRLYQIVAEEMEAPAPQFITIPTAVLEKVAPDWAGSIASNFFGHNLFDISAAKRDLNYRTTISFREGVRRVLTHRKELPANSAALARYERIVRTWQDIENALERETSETALTQ